jgi:ATPase subunit of ABC transporter with duplicated ATPase domains
MKIIAGIDQNFQGKVESTKEHQRTRLATGAGAQPRRYLKMIDIIREGKKEIFDILDEYNKISEQMGEPEVYEDADKMDKLLERQGTLQDKDRRGQRMGDRHCAGARYGCAAVP